MNCIAAILASLQAAPERTVLQEFRDGRLADTTAGKLADMVAQARRFLRSAGLAPGDRCAIIAPNSARWIALDLAVLAEGLIAVPLYVRQTTGELRAALSDCSPGLVCCGDRELAAGLSADWPAAPPQCAIEEIFSDVQTRDPSPEVADLTADDPVTIIYTSGTSGTSKGVMLTLGNLEHMLPCTSGRLDELLAGVPEPQRIFHYLPCCFAGSWILTLTALGRPGVLVLSGDLERLAEEIRVARPHVFLNVPALLERVRRGIEQRLARGASPRAVLFRRARGAWLRGAAGVRPGFADRLWNRVGQRLLFPAVRRRIGRDLVALICGSAPLAEDTQRFFEMLGLPVLQVYGLTETTAICTLDTPEAIVPGRVGRALPGIEMRLGEQDEILVRGPNLFLGYWNRPDETRAALADDWFRTGDRGEVDAAGNWRIVGRIKNMIVLNSGHNIVPDPLEEQLRRRLPRARQVMVVGNHRSHLAAIVTGAVSGAEIQAGLDAVNPALPHYQRIHKYCVHEEPFTPDNGLLTANGKLRREAIASRLAPKIDRLYHGSST